MVARSLDNYFRGAHPNWNIFGYGYGDRAWCYVIVSCKYRLDLEQILPRRFGL